MTNQISEVGQREREEELAQRREILSDAISDLMFDVARDMDSTTGTIERMNRQIETLQNELDELNALE